MMVILPSLAFWKEGEFYLDLELREVYDLRREKREIERVVVVRNGMDLFWGKWGIFI